MALIVGGVFAALLIGRLVRLVLVRLKLIQNGGRCVNDIVLTYIVTWVIIALLARWQSRLFMPGIAVMILYDIAMLKLKSSAGGNFRTSSDYTARSGDAYDVLGVHQNDSLDKIKQVYRKLQETYHPDKHAADSTEESIEQKTEKIKQINAAFQWILKHHRK